MSYIDKNLLADEHILFRTKKHLIIFFLPVVWAVIAIYAYSYMHNDILLVKLDWVPFFVAVVFGTYVWLEYATSEFVVTNKRIMMREGFFFRHTNETRLSAVARVNVDQSLLGQALGYGLVSINSFGGTVDAFAMLDAPFEFQKQVNEQLDKK